MSSEATEVTAEQIALLEQVVSPGILQCDNHRTASLYFPLVLIPSRRLKVWLFRSAKITAPFRQRLRDRGEHAGGLRSQAEALERASIAADREIALLKLQVYCRWIAVADS